MNNEKFSHLFSSSSMKAFCSFLLYPQYAYFRMYIQCYVFTLNNLSFSYLLNVWGIKKKYVKMLLFPFSYKYTYVFTSMWNTKHLFLLITIHFLLNHKILWLFAGCFIFFFQLESFCFSLSLHSFLLRSNVFMHVIAKIRWNLWDMYVCMYTDIVVVSADEESLFFIVLLFLWARFFSSKVYEWKKKYSYNTISCVDECLHTLCKPPKGFSLHDLFPAS